MARMRCVTVCHLWIGNQLITATNDGKSAPQFKKRHSDGAVSHSACAEMRAFQKAGRWRDFSTVKVHVMRVMANGSISMAKPCVHCQAFMFSRGVKARNVRFTNWAGEWERMRV